MPERRNSDGSEAREGNAAHEGNAARHRTVFVTREPMVHQVGGSTTSALNLLEVLARQGSEITMVATLAFSRSPRVWLRAKVTLPAGVRLALPGYVRVGRMYLRPFAAKAWARGMCRLAARVKVLLPLQRLAKACFGEGLFSDAWDLTPPTEGECRTALRAMNASCAKRTGGVTVISNYAFWGPLFDRMREKSGDASESMRARRVILMHDLLSARVRRFVEAGEALDCPNIEEATEMAWLESADCVLAAQEREVEYVKARVRTRVLVQPIVLQSQRLEGAAEAGRCLFVGSNILPNQVGLGFFLKKVWPKVRAENGAARLAVVGTICDWLAEGLERDGVVRMGVVDAIEEEYAKAAVCVIPLIIGSGIKIKLIEAMSFGKAIVATSVGVQGIEGWVGEAVDVVDDADAFAAAVLRLLRDATLRGEREEAALRLARAHYGAERELTPEFVEAVLGGPVRR